MATNFAENNGLRTQHVPLDPDYEAPECFTELAMATKPARLENQERRHPKTMDTVCSNVSMVRKSPSTTKLSRSVPLSCVPVGRIRSQST